MTQRACSFHDRRRRLRCTECGNTVDLCQCVDVEDLAFKRLSSETGQFLQAVFQAAQSHEGGSHLLERALTEFGIVAQKLVQNDRDRSVPDAEIRRELVKLAGTITFIAAVGTPEYAYPSD